MPYSRPTLPSLIDGTAGEVESRLPGILARVRRSLAGVLSRVLAGGLWGLHGYAEDLDRQKWPDLCDADYLAWHGARWGVAIREAQPASGTVLFTGVDGTAIPINTVLQRADRVQYSTQAAGLIAAGQALIGVVAAVPANAGNALINTSLSLVSPIPNINTIAIASTALTGGADLEDSESYRSRILQRVRKVPQGGAVHDYERWALEVPGVTRVWVNPLESGPGTVAVRFVRDNDVGSFIPDVGEVAAVQAYIDTLRPTTAAVTVSAPTAYPLNYTIHLDPDSADLRAAVDEELQNLTRGTDNVPGVTVYRSRQLEAIGAAPGMNNYVLTSPAADTVLAAGEMATHGVITWT